MVKPLKYSLLTIIASLFLTNINLFAVNDHKRDLINYKINLHAGTVLPHHETLIYLNNEYVRSLEFAAWFNNKSIENTYNTILGAGYFFSGLGNKEVYGNFHALYFGMLNPVLSNVLPVQFKVGVGSAYVCKTFDLENNYLNRAIGSHINAYGQLSLTGKVPLFNNSVLLRPGISFHHISNGAAVAPNQGLNLLTVSAGIEFDLGQKHSGSLVLHRDTTEFARNRFSVVYAPGFKQVDRRIDKQIFTSSLLLEYGYMFTSGRSLGIGVGFFYNDTWAYIPYTRLERDETLLPFQSALHLSLQREKGPLEFFLHPGVYIFNPAKDWPYMTNRLGLRYRTADNITFQFSIKSHWLAIADYFEWGIGYQFRR